MAVTHKLMKINVEIENAEQLYIIIIIINTVAFKNVICNF